MCCLEITYPNVFNIQNQANVLVAGVAAGRESTEMRRGSCTHPVTQPGASPEHSWEITTALKTKRSKNEFCTGKIAEEQLNLIIICEGLSLPRFIPPVAAKSRAVLEAEASSREVTMTLGFLAEYFQCLRWGSEITHTGTRAQPGA